MQTRSHWPKRWKTVPRLKNKGNAIYPGKRQFYEYELPNLLINGLGPEEKEAVMEIIASLGSLAIGVVILYIIVKLLSLPFKLVWNGIIGAVMLWLANLLGGALFNVKIHITIIKALIAGFFGIPGAAAVILWDLFVK